jgi:hypothetical protein
MKKFLALASAVVCLSATLVAEECLEVGSPVAAFFVQDVTGPSAGEKLCYRCNYGKRPVVSVFARNVDGEVASLIKQIDSVVGQNESKKMGAFVVLMTNQPDAQEAKLKEVAASQKIAHTPLTIFEGVAGPPAYKITKDADVTVMMWVGGELKVNQALKASELSKEKITGIVGETSKILN